VIAVNSRHLFRVSEKKLNTYFFDNFGKSGPIFLFTITFRKDLWRKLGLKLTPPLTMLPHYLAKM